MFDTNPRDLKDVLRAAQEGSLQLPEFQRGYVWAEDDVRSLLASVAKGFPVGALLTLEAGGVVDFEPRVLEGSPARGVRPDQLLLDGQQRVTSLYQALWSREAMLTRLARDGRKAVRRFFYIDIEKALEAGADVEDAIVPVRQDRLVIEDFKPTLDLSTPEKEYARHHFPLNIAFDSTAERAWFRGWRRHWQALDVDIGAMEDAFIARILEPVQSYKMPVIKLDRSSSREAVCLIFEKVNVGGKKLDAFELVTAIFAGAAQPLDLRADWSGRKGQPGRRERILRGPRAEGHENRALGEVRSIEFLQAVTLAHTRAARLRAQADAAQAAPQLSCKREAILALPIEAFRLHAEAVEEGFRFAGRFLNDRRIFWAPDVPYPAQVVALATVRAILGRAAETQAAQDRLVRWFWTTALSQDYGTSPETKLAKDAEELVGWVAGERGEPERLRLLGFNGDRLDSLRTRLAAAYKALNALLLGQGARDFITGHAAEINSFAHAPMDIHHIFPRAWCEKNGIPADRMDSIVNKTPLTSGSNQAIGGAAPSVYLRRIEERTGLAAPALDAILRSHLIEPEALRADDFEAFFAARKAALTELALSAMGRRGAAAPSAPASAPEEPVVELPDPEPETDREAA